MLTGSLQRAVFHPSSPCYAARQRWAQTLTENSRSGPALGLSCLWSSSLLCWLHPSNPRNVTAKAFVAKAGRTPHVPWLKIGLKVGERSFGKGLVEPRWFHNGFIFRVYAHPNTNGSCCFSSPEHFTPVLSCRLSLFPCDWPLPFLWGYFYSPRQLPPRSSFSLPTSPAAFPICKR